MLRNTGLNSHLVTLFPKIRWNELGQTSIHFTAASSMYHAHMIAVCCLAFPPTRLQLPSVYVPLLSTVLRRTLSPILQVPTLGMPETMTKMLFPDAPPAAMQQSCLQNGGCSPSQLPASLDHPGLKGAFIFHESLLKKNMPVSTCGAPLEGFPGRLLRW